ILRQNMHQKTQGPADAKLYTTLENMRYKNCTADDLAFLRLHIVGPDPGRPKLTDPQFRNVSIITAWNNQKDRINELGCQRFADDTKQPLSVFFSNDQYILSTEVSPIQADSNNAKCTCRTKDMVDFSDKDQKIIWNLSPHTSEHFPGKLQLCLDMPVIIKYNHATKLCITNGQEGIVAGWTTTLGTKNQLTLDPLFVYLENPPSLVSFPGLPPNVVPIPNSSKDITCVPSSDQMVHIKRQQV
ncbi:hypothetical protein HYDPIDRAFT_65467, partial [Hydnomerulius pinastri MD-312]